MNHLKDVIQTLFAEPFTTERCLAERLKIGKGSVYRYRGLIHEKGYTWEELRDLSLPDLDAKFNKRTREHDKVMPDFAVIVEEKKNPIVTLYHLWKEYRRRWGARGYSYAHYVDLYNAYVQKLPKSSEMRQTYKPGGVLYVDFSGQKPTYIDQATGFRVQAELFVGVLAASNYTFACVTRSASLVDVIDAHIQMFNYFGGVAETLTPDNMSTAVSATRWKGLKIQREFQQMSEHYGLATLPTRPYKPRDKGKVEGAVLIVQREILFPDRHEVFQSFEALEASVAKRLEELNLRAHSDRSESRRARFQQSDAHHLLKLPAAPFTYSTLRPRMKVPRCYHVKVDKHAYSVPFGLTGAQVQPQIFPGEVVLIHKHQEVARHRRSTVAGGTTTDAAHQRPNHRAQAMRKPKGFETWAKRVGRAALKFVKAQFDRKIPLVGITACDTLTSLTKHYTKAQIEQACKETLALGSRSVTDVQRALHQPRKRNTRDTHTFAVRRRAVSQHKESLPAA